MLIFSLSGNFLTNIINVKVYEYVTLTNMNYFINKLKLMTQITKPTAKFP